MKKRFFDLLIFSSLIIFIFSGCAKQSKVAKTSAPAPLPKELAVKLDKAAEIWSIRALIDTEIKYKGFKKRFNLAVVAKKPDWIRMEFVDPLAGPVLSVVSTPDRVIYADSSGVYYHNGENRAQAFKDITRLDWTPKETIRILMGETPTVVAANLKYPHDTKGRFWVNEGERAITWGEDEATLSYYKMNGGKVAAQIDYADYKPNRGIEFPTLIDVKIRRPKTDIKMKYKDIVLNREVKEAVFNQVNFVSYDNYTVHKTSQ